jgi:hypothetical protein
LFTMLKKKFELSCRAISSTLFSYGKQSLRPSVSTEGLSFQTPCPLKGELRSKHSLFVWNYAIVEMKD